MLRAAATRPHWRNFDAIRLAAATAVVLTHSFHLSTAGYYGDPTVKLFGEGNDLGLMAVGVFFIVSGFLITHSFVTRTSVRSYLVSRALRIFPGLLGCTLVTALVIGPWFATGSVLDYLTSPDTWSYVERTVLLQRDGGLGFPAPLYPGAQGTVMLGTTWSLAPEFACYLLVAALGIARGWRVLSAASLVAVGLWMHGHDWTLPIVSQLSAGLMFFASGATLYFIHQRARPTATHCALAAAGLIATMVAGYPMQGLATFGAVLIIQLATSTRIALPDATRYGDLSYGIYLYGWPMQQLVRVAWGPAILWWEMFLLAMPLATACGWLSWRLIERRAIAQGQAYRRRERERLPVGAKVAPSTT